MTRGTPDIKELEFSAGGICGEQDSDQIKDKLEPYFKPLAQAYKIICDKQNRDFFGLRDFYRFDCLYVVFMCVIHAHVNLQLDQNVVLDVQKIQRSTSDLASDEAFHYEKLWRIEIG